MVIFHSYVKLPEGNHGYPKWCCLARQRRWPQKWPRWHWHPPHPPHPPPPGITLRGKCVGNVPKNGGLMRIKWWFHGEKLWFNGEKWWFNDGKMMVKWWFDGDILGIDSHCLMVKSCSIRRHVFVKSRVFLDINLHSCEAEVKCSKTKLLNKWSAKTCLCPFLFGTQSPWFRGSPICNWGNKTMFLHLLHGAYQYWGVQIVGFRFSRTESHIKGSKNEQIVPAWVLDSYNNSAL